MTDFLILLRCLLASLFKSRAHLAAEILVLRQQMNVLRRHRPSRPRLTYFDRLVFVWMYRLIPRTLSALAVVKPETVVRWHRAGFQAYWRWKSRSPGGRSQIAPEIRQLIRDMSLANALWGAPRIHGELLKLGIDVGQTTVAKYMARHRRPPSQGWKTFLSNHADGIASIDLMVVPTIAFRPLYALVLLRHGRRQLLSIGVTTHPTAEWIARQMVEAFPWDQAPRYLIRVRDRAYGDVVRRRLRGMGIRDRPTSPRSPWQNGHVERLIGSIRRECLDHIVVCGERHLRRILNAYADYYNGVRTHLSLDKDALACRPVQPAGCIVPRPILGGLHHHYVRTIMSAFKFATGTGHCADQRHDLGALLATTSAIGAVEGKNLRKRYPERASDPNQRIERRWRMPGLNIRNLGERDSHSLPELGLGEAPLLPELPDDLAQSYPYRPVQGLRSLLRFD